MGIFFNPGNGSFTKDRNYEIYVDKTGLLDYTNSVLGTTDAYICNSRPRRFGKSYAANMLAAYYDKAAILKKCFLSWILQRQKILRYISINMM